MRVVIRGRKARFIYSDEAHAALSKLGPATITRASHVEPAAGGGWLVDLSPVGGPILADGDDECGGLNPFRTRAAALAAEVTWIEEHAL